MEAAGGGGAAAAGGGIALHDFMGRLGEQRVHFHAMRLRDSLFLWVGAAPALASLAVAMCSPRVSVPAAPPSPPGALRRRPAASAPGPPPGTKPRALCCAPLAGQRPGGRLAPGGPLRHRLRLSGPALG